MKKSTHSEPIPDPVPSPPMPVSLTVIFSLRDCKGQDKLITEKVSEGWEFVESLMVYGNEMLLRFRRK
jgi:hypothetical protein